MKRDLGCAAILAVVLAGAAVSETPKPFPDFSAKRVKPPKPGAGKSISVQIEEVTPVRSAVSAAETAVPNAGRYAWFWDKISPKIEASGPGRLEPALAALWAGPGGQSVASPRLQLMKDIAVAHGADIMRSTVSTRVSPALALAVIAVESSGRADAVSSAGATGLMQLMPATASRFGVEDSLVAAENIRGGVAFLDLLMTKFQGDPVLVLAAYNAGETSVDTHGGVPPFAETRDYVPKVLSAFNVARALCMTPPELIWDGCIFAVS